MARQLIGQAWLQPLEQVSRIENNQSMQRNRDMRTQEMPIQVENRRHYQDQMAKHWQDMFNFHMGQLDLSREKLKEAVREYNDLAPYKKKSLLMGGNRMPAFAYAQNDALSIAQQFGALDPSTGKIDRNKIPGSYREKFDQDMLYAQKSSTTTYLEKRISQMKNTLDSINKIDIKPLQHYAGAQGQARLKRDAYLKRSGQQPKIYDDYTNLVNTVIPTAAEQLGQAFGGSVQENATNIRNKAFYDKSWASNPDIVAKSIASLRDVAQTELANEVNQATNSDFLPSLAQGLQGGGYGMGGDDEEQDMPPPPSASSATIKTRSGSEIPESIIRDYAQRNGMSEAQATSLIIDNL